MREERLFTPEEADAMLAELGPRLERIREARQRIIRTSERISEAVATDGGGIQGTDYFDALDVLRAEVERLATQDVLLRDAEIGLVDFPTDRDGQRAFLCWRLGEERVSWWHPVESGFAGRRPL